MGPHSLEPPHRVLPGIRTAGAHAAMLALSDEDHGKTVVLAADLPDFGRVFLASMERADRLIVTLPDGGTLEMMPAPGVSGWLRRRLAPLFSPRIRSMGPLVASEPTHGYEAELHPVPGYRMWLHGGSSDHDRELV